MEKGCSFFSSLEMCALNRDWLFSVHAESFTSTKWHCFFIECHTWINLCKTKTISTIHGLWIVNRNTKMRKFCQNKWMSYIAWCFFPSFKMVNSKYMYIEQNKVHHAIFSQEHGNVNKVEMRVNQTMYKNMYKLQNCCKQFAWMFILFHKQKTNVPL